MKPENNKYKLLRKGILFDVIGMFSYMIPIIGPFTDIIWAPIAAHQMKKMYPGKKGKLASIIVFLEEILPYTDIIPSFTLMWIYTFVWERFTSPVLEQTDSVSNY